MELTITSENFESLKNGEQPLVVDFWAEWCGPCRNVAPVIAELAEEYDGRIKVGKCNVEENDELTAEYGIRNIPTILFFKGGLMVDKLSVCFRRAVPLLSRGQRRRVISLQSVRAILSDRGHRYRNTPRSPYHRLLPVS